MKKFLCVFLAAFFAAALGFTQELKFDGYINSGLGLWISDKEGDTNPKVMAYGVDSERYIGRFRLNGAYTNEEKTAGANFRFQVQGKGWAPSVTSGKGGTPEHTHSVTTGFPMDTPALTVGYGWVKFLDMITIKAGLVDDGTWQTADYIYNDDQSEGAGVLVRVSPIKGLDIGAGGFVATPNSSGNNNFFGVNLPTQLMWDEAKYTFSAAYTMEDVFRFMVSGRPANKTGGDAKYNRSNILAEFRLLAVDNLTAVVVGQMDNFDKDDNNKLINIYETFGYKIGNLGLGLNAAQYIVMEQTDANKKKDAPTDIAVWVNPWVSYGFKEGAVVPRLDIVYFMGGAIDGENYQRRGFVANNNKDAYVINARPSVKINVNSKASFEIGDSFYYTKAGSKADAVINNVFYVDLVVKF